MIRNYTRNKMVLSTGHSNAVRTSCGLIQATILPLFAKKKPHQDTWSSGHWSTVTPHPQSKASVQPTQPQHYNPRGNEITWMNITSLLPLFAKKKPRQDTWSSGHQSTMICPQSTCSAHSTTALQPRGNEITLMNSISLTSQAFHVCQWRWWPICNIQQD
jgi:hypothetical protein